jgi:NAD-dependent deacetylase
VTDPVLPTLTDAARLLAPSRRLLVLTGAGMSADAGVPTFRSEGGLWRTFKVEDMATPDGFHRNPELVWDWYRERRLLVAGREPHPGQRSLALLQQHFPAGQVLVATTNEDDLLDRAGVTEVIHLHGSLFDTACSAGCGWRDRDGEDNSLSMRPCPRCGSPSRPGSVWFGEPLAPGSLEAIQRFNADGCLLVGSSCLVQPVSRLPVGLAEAKVPVVELNPEATPFTPHAACSLRGTAKDLLPDLVDLLTSRTMRDQQFRLT